MSFVPPGIPPHVPKAVLYYSPISIWAAAPRLALEEKGYGEEEIELKVVDIGKAENFSTAFLRLNNYGTVPTLVVPLANHLAPEDDHQFKAIKDTKSILEFLDKSRTAISRTHTTSPAPAPALAPATIALSSLATSLISLLHSAEGVDPNALFHYNYVSSAPPSTAITEAHIGFYSGRVHSLAEYLDASEKPESGVHASQKTKDFWGEKKAENEALLGAWKSASKAEGELGPEEKQALHEFAEKANELWGVKLRKLLTELSHEMIGPFALGDQISIADLHLAPYLARIAFLSDGLPTDSGDTIISKIETRINSSLSLLNPGESFTLPRDFQILNVSPNPAATAAGGDHGSLGESLDLTPGAKRTKLAAFWDEMRGRPSWKKVYGNGLF